MKPIVGDNVFFLNIGAVLIPALAVIFIGFHILFSDGPHAVQEIQFLEYLAGGGGIITGAYSAFHAWLVKKFSPPTPTPPGAQAAPSEP